MRCWFTPLLSALARVVARLPQRALIACGRALAWTATWPLASRRRVARINTARCFPELDVREQRRIADTAGINAVVALFELMKAWYAPASALRGLARIDGLPHLQGALAGGRGVLLVTGHFTHYEMAMRLIGDALGRPLRYVARPHNSACLQAWIEASRQRVFGETLGKKKLREPLAELLRAGEPVCWLGDQDFNRDPAFVPFFDVAAATVTALPELARAGDAVVLAFWSRRERDGTYTIRIEPQWAGWPSGDAVADAARYMAELEQAVRECPGQYLWTHKRFKTRPDGAPSPYGPRGGGE